MALDTNNEPCLSMKVCRLEIENEHSFLLGRLNLRSPKMPNEVMKNVLMLVCLP